MMKKMAKGLILSLLFFTLSSSSVLAANEASLRGVACGNCRKGSLIQSERYAYSYATDRTFACDHNLPSNYHWVWMDVYDTVLTCNTCHSITTVDTWSEEVVKCVAR